MSFIVISIVICIINSYRVKSAHVILKKYIQHSQGDLLVTWQAIEQAVTNQISTIYIQLAQSRISTPLDIDQVSLINLTIIIITVLILINRQYSRIALVILQSQHSVRLRTT